MMLYTFAQLEAAKAANDASLAHQIASTMLMMGDTESSGAHNKVLMVYAWSLEKMGRYGEALQYYRMAEVHYNGVDTRLTPVAALMITRQARMLRQLGIQNAATAMLADLRSRAQREILNADHLATIYRQIERALA